MDSKRNGNLAKLVAFFLIVTVLVMAIAFSVSGWQGEDYPTEPGGDSTLTDAEPDDEKEQPPKEEEQKAPVYTHYISGLEISETESLLKPLCIVYDSEAPMYGISSSFLTVEIPTEEGRTRLLAFTNDATSQGKLGALAPTRKYISNIAAYFGAVPVFHGCDDSFSYSGTELKDGCVDFSSASGYHYTEYGMYSYTNKDLIASYIKNNNVSTVMTTPVTVPYTFATPTTGSIQANTVLVQFDRGSTTELIYSSESGKYRVQKNNVPLEDKLTDGCPEYDNVFVLYANATTHETIDATEMILDTVSGGSGYYVNRGYAQKISWTVNESGAMQFLDAKGEILSVAAGTSYMAFAKASQASYTRLG